MKEQLVLFFSLCLIAYAGYGQALPLGQETDEIILLNVQAIRAAGFDVRNVAIIEQIGNNNEALVYQDNSSYQPNITIIQQADIAHKGLVQQIGSGHQALMIQRGNANEANLLTVGEYVGLKVEQNGAMNKINAYIENYGEPFSGDLNQNGDRNIIDLAVFDGGITTGRQIGISQTGNGQEVRATVDPYGSAVGITQLPGFMGEGMKVNVTTFR